MDVCYRFTSILVLMSLTYNLGSKSSAAIVEASGKKNNECEHCKILTKSVNYWLDKTSRGKHEGGDTAWEEAKLKSYARSEMRLVEIQEGLCSEMKSGTQNYCYAIIEKADHLLEKWWFHENYQSLDLFSWLCVETLQHCCPDNHFGPSCDPCPLNNHHKVCSGRGKCSGDGTRKGNGTCICKRGYSGNLCEDCAENFYPTNQGICTSCHASCDGCDDYGTNACHKCNNGWQMEFGECIDIDECVDTKSCNLHQFCINQEGSYKCQDCDMSCRSCVGLGINNCTSCQNDFVLMNGKCLHVRDLQLMALFTAICIIVTGLIYYFAKLPIFVVIYLLTFLAILVLYVPKYVEAGFSDATITYLYGLLKQR